jgi:putative colanic acid biosysnthesis UDP-glucose lipid carrier transferase
VLGPMIFRRTFLLSLIALLKAVLPPVVVVAMLYLTADIFSIGFGPVMTGAGVIAFALSLVLLQPPPSATSFMSVPPPLVVLNTVTRWAIVFAILLTIAYVAKFSAYFPRRLILTWAVLTPTLLVPIMLLLNEALRRVICDPANSRRAVFVGCNASSLALARRVTASADVGVTLLGFFDDRTPQRLGLESGIGLLGRHSDVANYVKKNDVQVVFISLPIRHAQRFIDLLDGLSDTTASIYYVPDIFAFELIQSHPRDVLGIPVVAMCETPLFGYSAVVKRVMDICISAGLLLAMAPLFAALAIVIRLNSPGPAIFKQRRYGLDGQEFLVYKFRTMKVMEDGPAVMQATQGDHRVTRLGAFLRKNSLDELPQLINVLQGRMSLVGPRPHAVAHNEQYRKLIRGYMLRHKVLPGITGLAQVNGCRGETSKLEDMQARIRYDLDYLKRWSPVLDLKILILTAFRAFGDDKAY